MRTTPENKVLVVKTAACPGPRSNAPEDCCTRDRTAACRRSTANRAFHGDPESAFQSRQLCGPHRKTSSAARASAVSTGPDGAIQRSVQLDGPAVRHANGCRRPLEHRFPSQHWRSLRTNNPLERIMRKIRRRTRVVRTFPDDNSAMMLVAARLRHIAGKNWDTKCYMVMARLAAIRVRVSLASISQSARTFPSLRRRHQLPKTKYQLRSFPRSYRLYRKCGTLWTLPPTIQIAAQVARDEAAGPSQTRRSGVEETLSYSRTPAPLARVARTASLLVFACRASRPKYLSSDPSSNTTRSSLAHSPPPRLPLSA